MGVYCVVWVWCTRKGRERQKKKDESLDILRDARMKEFGLNSSSVELYRRSLW